MEESSYCVKQISWKDQLPYQKKKKNAYSDLNFKLWIKVGKLSIPNHVYSIVIAMNKNLL